MDADVSVVVPTATRGERVVVTATKTLVELLVEKQTWLEPRKIGSFKFVSKGSELLYFEPTQTVARQGHLMPAKLITKVHPNVALDILVVNLTNITRPVLE